MIPAARASVQLRGGLRRADMTGAGPLVVCMRPVRAGACAREGGRCVSVLRSGWVSRRLLARLQSEPWQCTAQSNEHEHPEHSPLMRLKCCCIAAHAAHCSDTGAPRHPCNPFSCSLSIATPIVLRPLSTNMTCPVTAEASGEHRKAATLPTSRACSSFLMGALAYE